MISIPEPTLRPTPSGYSLAEIPGAFFRLFHSYDPSAALIVSCPSATSPAFLSIRRRGDDEAPQAVIWTSPPWNAADQRIRDFFRGRSIPLAEDRGLMRPFGIHQLIYTLTVPVEAMAGVVTDLLEKCFLVSPDEPLDFSFIRA